MRDIKNKNITWWISLTSCVMLFALIGIFAYTKMSFLLNGVQIEAKIDRSGDSSPLATIKGKAEHATYVSLNGREIYIDKDGSFNEHIALIPGLSIITIDTTDKFGNAKEKKIQVVYKQSAGTVAMAK